MTPSMAPPVMLVPMLVPMIPMTGAGSMASTRCGGAPTCPPMSAGASPDMEAAFKDLSRALMKLVNTLMKGMGVKGPHKGKRRDARSGGRPVGSASFPKDGQAASGSSAVELGKRFLGRSSITIKGKLPHFTAAGGQTNNCADFVSSCLQATGGLKGHFVEVNALEGALKRQGWRRVSAGQARPGDVWINPSRGHVQLVASHGATRTIGSNNDRPGHQVISMRSNDPGSAVYYTRA